MRKLIFIYLFLPFLIYGQVDYSWESNPVSEKYTTLAKEAEKNQNFELANNYYAKAIKLEKESKEFYSYDFETGEKFYHEDPLTRYFQANLFLGFNKEFESYLMLSKMRRSYTIVDPYLKELILCMESVSLMHSVYKAWYSDDLDESYKFRIFFKDQSNGIHVNGKLDLKRLYYFLREAYKPVQIACDMVSKTPDLTKCGCATIEQFNKKLTTKNGEFILDYSP